jgi:hypothetical protein
VAEHDPDRGEREEADEDQPGHVQLTSTCLIRTVVRTGVECVVSAIAVLAWLTGGRRQLISEYGFLPDHVASSAQP